MSSYDGGVKSLTFFLTDRLFLCSGDSIYRERRHNRFDFIIEYKYVVCIKNKNQWMTHELPMYLPTSKVTFKIFFFLITTKIIIY